ncbi:Peregrin [Trametes pubescens]|uniref:Peregrin n=1 Tax=Trametes pubescens TaxID=154538 RepID=A0A1M2W0W9_TRAPU|nr:Peregrin [Trametes pubescens]
MARGGASPAPNPLPKVSFVRVTDEVTQQPPGVHDHVARSYGYNDFNDEFMRPEEHYIRYIEPLESDLATQVEYDMDEQDQEWLDAVNIERKALQLDKISYETFEIIMDRLEKEWFDLSKNIPKSDMALPSEDSTCAICDDSEGENTNAIVFCDGCNLAVHQDCYGVPYIPEGQWLCRKCTVSPENPVSCILCPNEGGAFKQTVSGDWVHLLCAIWVPETAVANDVFMEPITGVERISKQRWRLRCSVCDIREGACIQCSKASCFVAFHATCARKEKLLMPMKATQGSEAPTLACYCEKHLPREQQEARLAAFRAQAPEDSDAEGGQANAKSNKTARAYAKTYKPGPPLVPRIIVNRILQYISRISVRHKPEFVQLVCRYWSLKREARRGAPLLKRLHLEPWTANSGSKLQTDAEKVAKLEYMRKLRLDLERVRLIIDVIRHRESAKQKQQEQIQLVLSRIFFPHEPALRFTFEKILSYDRQGYFKSPVNKNEVPDYYDIVKEPMCWDTIDQKLDSHEYLDLAQFKRDVALVVANAMAYNQTNTPFYKTASRIQGNMPHIFADLDRNLSMRPSGLKVEPVDNDHLISGHLDMSHPDGEQTGEEHLSSERILSQTPPEEPLPPTGDLEPPLELLELLVSEELIRQDTNVIMMSQPIESLLSYEMPNIRPLAPPPPPPKAKPKPKPRPQPQSQPQTQSEESEQEKGRRQRPKLDRKAALERKRLERLRALDNSPGFRAPRTRAAMAAAVAFEVEATGSSQPPETEPAAESSSAAEMGEDTASSSKPTPARKPRRSMVHVPRDLPLTVDNVDNRKSFTMFERGWILPPDQKRGGRARVERNPLPPPKKKAKNSHEGTRLSVSSSAHGEGSRSHITEGESVEHTPHDTTISHPTEGDVSIADVSTIGNPPEDIPGPSASAIEVTAPGHDSLPLEPPEHEDVDPAPPSTPEPMAVEPITSPPDPPALHASSDDREPASVEAAPMDVDGPVPTDIPREEDIDVEILDEDVLPPVVVNRTLPQEEQMEEQEKVHALDVQQEPEVDSLSERPLEPAPDPELAPESEHEYEHEVEQEPEQEPQLAPEQGEEQSPEHATEQKSAEQEQEPVPEVPQAPIPEESPQEEDEDEDTGPINIIYIDELDTPATRKEKNLIKKLKRQAAREAREAAARAAAGESSPAPAPGPSPRHEQPSAGPSRSRLPSDALDDYDSELTDLSDGDDDGEQDAEIPSAAGPGVLQKPEEGPAMFRSSRRGPPLPQEVEPGSITVKPGEKLEGGTLVWAKIESFPWWPAVVFEEDDPEVPESVVARIPPSEPDLELVRFYEKKHINNWAWVRHRNMRYLGEDDSLDAQMLAPVSKYQRWRSAPRRTECRNAYQDALAEMEADGEAQAAGGVPQGGSSRTRTQVAGQSRAIGAPDPSPGRLRKAEVSRIAPGEDLLPAAMGADSPMTDVDSVE